MDDLFKVSLGSLLLLTLTIAAEERKPSTEPTAVFVTPQYEPTTSTTTKRISPLRFTFPPPRRDQQRAQTRQKVYEDTSLTQNIPATYESIVYNPDSKDATSIFSRSNFWDMPDVFIQETSQQKLGKNSIVTKTSRNEYTPNYRSVQTPLREIQYQPVSEPEAEEEESQKNEETEEHVEEEGDEVEELVEEDDVKPTYPTNLQNQKFEPFESSDFYGDVLNNIGSIFSDEENKHTVKNLLPQFEEHSYENLQKDEDDNEELEEYDQVEDEETTAVTQPPVKPTLAQPVLKQSPFPSVRILTNSTKPEKPRKTFSPWLATEKPRKPALQFSPWLPTQQTILQPVKTWPVSSTHQPVKTWPVLSTQQPIKPVVSTVKPVKLGKPVKKYSARRPKKSSNRRVDSPGMVFVTPVPSADQGGVESNIAQSIDELYSNQHTRV